MALQPFLALDAVLVYCGITVTGIGGKEEQMTLFFYGGQNENNPNQTTKFPFVFSSTPAKESQKLPSLQ